MQYAHLFIPETHEREGPITRILPSLAALAAFEAAARHLSFTRAAEELGLTQSAVSRQVAQLEAHVGIGLFERVRRRVVLTETGRAYAARIRSMLDQAEAATLDVLASRSGGRVLHIVALATFGAHWLTPRMGRFAAAHPDIPFQITSYPHGPLPPSAEGDVLIHYGEASWPGGLLHRIMDEEIVAACTPAYAAAAGLRAAADLGGAVLLQQTTRPDAWASLLAKLGCAHVNALRGPRFDLYAMVIEAALAGLGVGAIPRFLIAPQLAAGRLVMPVPGAVRSRHAYYLVYAEAKRQWPEVQAFRAWLLHEARLSQRGG